MTTKQFFKTKIEEAEYRKVCEDLIQARGKKWQIKKHMLKGNLWWIDFGEDCFNRGLSKSEQAVKDWILKLKESRLNCRECGASLPDEVMDELAKEYLGIDSEEKK
jgi:hypothetical protein